MSSRQDQLRNGHSHLCPVTSSMRRTLSELSVYGAIRVFSIRTEQVKSFTQRCLTEIHTCSIQRRSDAYIYTRAVRGARNNHSRQFLSNCQLRLLHSMISFVELRGRYGPLAPRTESSSPTPAVPVICLWSIWTKSLSRFH